MAQEITLSYLLTRALKRHAAKVAVVEGGRSKTYAQLDARSSSLGSALREMGCEPGDRVAILMDNCSEFIETELAVVRSGFVKVPINNRLPAPDVERILVDCEARVVVFGAAYAHLMQGIRGNLHALKDVICVDTPGRFLDYEGVIAKTAPTQAEFPVVDADPELNCLIRYSGGTTGQPKGIVHTSGALAAVTLSVLREYGLTSDTRFLNVAHLSHGQNFVWPALVVAGARMVMLKKFDPVAVLRAIESERITRLHLVPTMAALVLDDPGFDSYDLSSLQNFLYASAPMPVERIKQLRQKLRCNISQAYTLSESPVITTVLCAQDHDTGQSDFNPKRLASCGREALDVRVRIVDDEGKDVPVGEIGELAILSPGNMKEYWRNPELTQRGLRDGWVMTADLGRRDEDGYIYLVDRKDDKIITGALNVYPREVEEVLHAHPAVREAAVGGIPDEKWGEAIVAFVVLKAGESVSAEDLGSFCEMRMAGYKKPKRIVFLDDLPKTPIGKIARRELVAPYWAGKSRRVN